MPARAVLLARRLLVAGVLALGLWASLYLLIGTGLGPVVPVLETHLGALAPTVTGLLVLLILVSSSGLQLLATVIKTLTGLGRDVGTTGGVVGRLFVAGALSVAVLTPVLWVIKYAVVHLAAVLSPTIVAVVPLLVPAALVIYFYTETGRKVVLDTIDRLVDLVLVVAGV